MSLQNYGMAFYTKSYQIIRSLDEAITCWKYKKSLQGHNRYEKSDLVVLD